MEIFEGNGAECMVKFIADGRIGKITRNIDKEQVIVAHKGKDGVVWVGDFYGHVWLYEPCTYIPPEPQWIECTAGEALDAYMKKRKVQYTQMGDWRDVPEGYVLRYWDMLLKYRKEA